MIYIYYAKQAKLYYKLHLVLGLMLSSKLNLDLDKVLHNINSSRLKYCSKRKTKILFSYCVNISKSISIKKKTMKLNLTKNRIPPNS